MLEWLKKLGGGTAGRNKPGLDDKSLALLAEDFDALEKVDADLPAEVLRYILDGEGEEILTRLASMPDAGRAMGFDGLTRGIGGRGESARGRFFESVQCVDPHFFVRLGKTYEALASFKKSALLGQFAHLATQLPQNAFGDPRLEWLEHLLMQANQLNLHAWPRICHPCAALNGELVEAMLKADGHSPDILARIAFQPQLEKYRAPVLEAVFESMSGFAELTIRHQQVVLEALSHSDVKQRAYALEMMKNCQVPLEPFLEKLVELALSSSKVIRQQSQWLLAGAKPTARPWLERKLAEGGTDERAAAAALLWEWEGEAIRPLLETHAGAEKNKKVLQAIQQILVVSRSKSEHTPADELLKVPPLAPLPTHAPLSADTERAWRETFDKINQAIAEIPAGSQAQQALTTKQISADAIGKAFAQLQTGAEANFLPIDRYYMGGWKKFDEALKSFWQRPELQPIHFVRFLVQLDAIKLDAEHDPQILAYGMWLGTLLPAFRRTHPETGLRELAAAFTAVGLNARRIGASELTRSFGGRASQSMGKAQIWPYWAEHLELLEGAFAPPTGDFLQRYHHRDARPRAFEALASFPTPPPRLLPLLWDLALGPKGERPDAQRCLENVPDKMERLTAALQGGSAESRFAAAEWLGRLGDASVTSALLTALKSEKNEATKGALMAALALLDVPIDQFLDRPGLLKDAEKEAAKELPEDLKWFPFGQLPMVHWEDTGTEVHPAIIRKWLVQGFKLKNPQPGALLRCYCASLKPTEREALGQFILEAWIAQDTAPISRTDAEAQAKSHAQSMAHYGQYFYQQAQNNPQTAATARPPLTEDQYYAQALPAMLIQPKGSATASKGILSVAGACVSGAASPVVSRYLKQWYGQRAAQCRALLQMLAWVEHRTATQLLLAVGSRFRTKSIQEEANTQAQALAERKGWTVAELADRTIPSAGLDENGVMTIDYGPRQFFAKLNEDREFALMDGDGKILKALPEPRKDDDEAKATEAKKLFSAAKKELKSVVTMQRDRFYEAMCTQRTWSFEDWNLYLNQHPIVKHHCQQLVWSVVRDGKTAQLFRPLADGSLTDAADDPVTLAGADTIRVAHECQVTPEQSKAWRQHLKDYNVETMFEQFGRLSFNLSEERQSETEIGDFQGHLLEAFKLRGRANKLGYSRGQAQDGGWFFDYHKRFPTLGIEAVIEFTGNGMPEENRTVALTNLHFNHVGEGESEGGQAQMMFSEIPAVLLSECWNDIRSIAAEGPGLDPEWEKKTQY